MSKSEWPDFKRCKACIEDSEKRISESHRFGEMETAEDYADALRHYLNEHSNSDHLKAVFNGFKLTTTCADCGESFVSEVRVSDGLRVRSYCDECAEADIPVLAIVYRQVSVDEVLPKLSNQNTN
jgi:hypothetical protein